MVNNALEIPVIKVIQQNKTIYVGKMLCRDILDRCVTTEWDPDKGWDLNQQGYQRAPNEKHYTRIAGFLKNEGDPLLPTSALLCARENEYGVLDFVPYGNNIPNVGMIRIPQERQLFIVDYQHRWRGLKYAVENLKCSNLLSFEVPVVVMADVDRYEEIRQFYLINSKQKRVDTDLGLALLQTMSTQANEKELINFVGSGNKYRIRATRLTFTIASKMQGPWVGRIVDPNMVATGNQVVSIKSFVDSLRPLLTRTSPVYMKTDAELVQIILNYWSGIERLMPNAFGSPKNYLIQAALGVFVMHRVAKRIFQTCIQENDIDMTPLMVAKILGKAKSKYLDENHWKVGGSMKAYSSASGQKELADEIIKSL